MINEYYKHIPTEDEIIQAESTMTDEQKESSKIREGNTFQEVNPFEDFLDQLDKNSERRPATEEEKKIMDARLLKLGELFEHSGVRWHLDGAINISLMKGEYIGVHKDVDVSIEEEDLNKLEVQLHNKGYGFFLSKKIDSDDSENKTIVERVNAKEFSDSTSEHLLINAIDDQGKINNDAILKSIDVHIVRRSKNGDKIVGRGIKIPNKWTKGKTILFKGQEINLSHPADVAFYKLHTNRTYDLYDLRALAESNKISLEDISEIQQLFSEEDMKGRQELEDIINPVIKKLQPGMSSDEIMDIFLQQSAIINSIDKIREPLKLLSQKIVINESTSKKEIMALINEIFHFDKVTEERYKRIEQLKEWIINAEKK